MLDEDDLEPVPAETHPGATTHVPEPATEPVRA